MDIAKLVYLILLIAGMVIYSLISISKAGIGFNRGFRNRPASRWFIVFFVELGVLVFVAGCVNPFVIANEQFRLPHLVLMIVLISAEIAAGSWCAHMDEKDAVKVIANG